MKKFFKSKRAKKPQPLEIQESSTIDYLNTPTSGYNPVSLPSSLNQPSARAYEESYDIEHVSKGSNKLNTSAKQNTFTNADKGTEIDDRTMDIATDYSLVIDGKPIYVVKQKKGYLSILFSLAQTIVLVIMILQCGLAPMNINPMVGPYPDALSYWGGKNSYDILYDQEYWRLFSPVMLHAGIFHLLCNVAVQLDTGAFFEREWGSLIWFIIYIGSAASGSILSVIVSPNSIGVGSSGSVCGLFGAKLAEALCRSRESTKTDDKQLSHAILCEQFGSTLCSVILILAFSFIPYVDWAAHVGGLLGGFTIGLMVFALQIKTWNWKMIMFTFGLLMTFLIFCLGTLNMIKNTKNNVDEEMADVCGFYMERFPDYVCNCMLERHEENN